MAPGLQLFALLSASGAPIMLTDCRECLAARPRNRPAALILRHGFQTTRSV